MRKSYCFPSNLYVLKQHVGKQRLRGLAEAPPCYFALAYGHLGGCLALCLLCTLAVLQCSWCWGQWPSTESDLPIYPAVFGCCPSRLMVRAVNLSNQCLSPSPFFSPFKMSLAAKPPSAIVSPGWAHPFQLVCTINSARAWALGWKSRALHNFIFESLCEKRHFLS